ncbi:acyl-CoA dehydrogenase family protein [Sphingomonas sp. LY160]|uniref:acyl-CoA dehydrogenase family protein n=1 Tax=Sphingomonas sp. LY160 TaxID=3095342 RepID=UPI002ADED4DE|nr:acyl-CoA dehydrogenase family protein [Sphingomonas sp. LY160]MEA1070988.1 acyl-CoA dehydrogenase family protein [Sphingomonas sp. LY160]
MSFTAPIRDQRLVLNTAVRIGEIEGAPEADMIEAVLEGAAALAEGEFAPLDRIGDTVGARWDNGVVRMPEGFHAAYRAFVEGGWMTLSAPEDAGGQALPFALAAALMENLNAANLGFALLPMLSMGAIEALEQHGSDELKRDYLPKIVSGEWPATMNLTEPQAGSDVGALRSKAEPVGDGSWRVSGTKIYITYGEHDLAEQIVHLVLARTPDAPEGTRGISLFLVPKVLPDGTPNDVRCVSIEHKLGIHASPTCVMSYGDQGGAIGWLVGPEMGGMRAMFTMMNNARLNVGLQGVGIAERATQRAVAYAIERKQGQRNRLPVAIADHPDVRRMLLRMRSLTTAARALVYYSFGEVDRGARGDPASNFRAEIMTPLAKAWGTDVGCEVASLGIQVHGGMGFIEETGAAQHLRDARIAPIYEGTNGIQAADLVGRKLDLDGGLAFDSVIADVRADTRDVRLIALSDAVEVAAATLRASAPDDRLAGSYPFLTMTSVLVAGWLVERLSLDEGADERTKAAAGYFLAVVVPEAIGLAAAAEEGAALLYSVPAEALA